MSRNYWKRMEIERKGWRKIGIEPMMFLYMSAFMITSVLEESFFVYKACTVDFGIAEDICRNISQDQYKSIKTEVQIKTSTFHQWNNIAYHIVPIGLSFFLGAWSDKVGRKLPILIGIAGNVYYSLMIVLISQMKTWPLDTVIWLASFPCALTGSSLTVFMAAFSYLADTTSSESRTLRTTLVEVAYLLPMPLGVAVGSYLFYNVVGQSYGIMFTISAALHGSAMLYSWICLDWKTNNSANRNSSSSRAGVFTLSHVKDSLNALVKPRPGSRRMCLLLSLLAMTLYTFQRVTHCQGGLPAGAIAYGKSNGLSNGILVFAITSKFEGLMAILLRQSRKLKKKAGGDG
ncbi:unnamed protein product [Nesidiocoris tenuis]|uniref:Major facilitator superfamily (MFS) profile domain-containing protein n=1 Tax=Nesidiocoris tenuis TaxID=355587 RepID=A0A6H5G7M3_9HEMI|nr:unnamed protein product [Nesidiocoris tenuis]